MKMKSLLVAGLSVLTLAACQPAAKKEEPKGMELLKVSANHRFFETEDGKPFFWLGDTGWLLFTKLNREETEKYLETRKEQGFNVIQAMVLHGLGAVNVYGDSALVNHSVATPNVTEGNDFSDSIQYDYWDNMDYAIDLAAEKGLYMALVPVWGNNVKDGGVSRDEAAVYGRWIADRYKDRKNIIWLNGGDTFGSDSAATWNILGNALRDNDPNHLITFHPRGRMQSNDWFLDESWMDFNMIQSGHRRYDQDDTERGYAQDNYKYIFEDWDLTPVRPTIDGEPSYEGIPQGLHDTLQPFWNDADVRRYAYWSVFAGAFGYTYGHSAVMQFYQPGDKAAAYGAKDYWTKAINDPGANQMKYVKELMLSRPYFDRVPDQSLIAGENGEKYDFLIATRGNDYAFIYSYNGRDIPVQMGKITGSKVKASWFNPRNGQFSAIGEFENTGVQSFDPPGDAGDGHDYVLVLDSVK